MLSPELKLPTVELKYNPFTNKTKIRFNGHDPRINSLVEKYQDKMLQTWINKIPKIFHDEMNGYNFELVFHGTKRDFSELEKVFDAVKEADPKVKVKLSHKVKLEEREEKLKKLDELLNWLKENENDHFNLNAFLTDNRKLFDEPYSFLIIGGRGFNTSKLEAKDISVEEVEDVKKLDDTVLKDTPLLICVDRKSLPDLQGIIQYFKARKSDVREEQIFFYIHPSVDAGNVVRIIQDLGIQKPNIVDGADDEKIMRYFEIFPFTQYIVNVTMLLDEQIASIESVLDTEDEKTTKSNALVHAHLKETDDTISRLKVTRDFLEKREEMEVPERWKEIKRDFIDSILDWKKNKTRTTKVGQAYEQAGEFNVEIGRQYDRYTHNILKDLDLEKEDRKIILSDLYACAKTDTDYSPELPQIPAIGTETVPNLTLYFMDMKEEVTVNPMDDFMGFFLKGGMQQPIIETGYYYKNWREYAVKIVEPLADRLIERCYAALRAFDAEATEIYINHVQELIDFHTEERKKSSENLSAEEKKVQEDKAWLQELTDRVKDIQTG